MTGILLLHGFGGDAQEVAPLVCCFDPKKYHVAICHLAGHTGRRKDLAKTTWQDWVCSAREAFLKLYDLCSEVICIGFSMGGLLAARLCTEYPVRAAVFVNTPYYFWNFPQIWANIKTDVRRYGSFYLKNSVNKPLRSLVSFLWLLHKTRPLYGRITCSSLILQTEDDDTTHPKSAEELKSLLGTNATLVYLKEGGHAVFQSDQSAEAMKQIKRFLSRIA